MKCKNLNYITGDIYKPFLTTDITLYEHLQGLFQQTPNLCRRLVMTDLDRRAISDRYHLVIIICL